MKSGIVCAILLLVLIPASVGAREPSGQSFPYGLLEIRGYPMEMSREGKFRIYSGSTTFVRGTFRIDGNKMVIFDRGGQYACRGKRLNPGSYFWTVRDHALYLMLIKDNCGARRSAFLEAPLKTRLP